MRLRNLHESEGNKPRVPSDWIVDQFDQDEDVNTEYSIFYNDSDDVTVVVYYNKEKGYVSINVISGYDTEASRRTDIAQYDFDTDDIDYFKVLFNVSQGLEDMRDKFAENLPIGDVFTHIEESTVKTILSSTMEKKLKKLR